MSKETMRWLWKNIKVGYTEQRGHAWHYKASELDSVANHYPGPIPVADVLAMFDFDVIGQPIFIQDHTGQYVQVANRQAMVAQDTLDVFGVFKDGFVGHPYREWLIDHVVRLLDDGELGMASAGLLKNRALAFVSVEMPETINSPQGVGFRPVLIASTAFDGSLATTYKGDSVTLPVCDNTLSAGLAGQDNRIKIKHSKHSNLRINDARQALGIVYEIADDFQKELDRLCSWGVTEQEWSKLLDVQVPRPDDKGRAQTMADNKRETLDRLYHWDPRCAPWKDTAFGVMQAYNTYEHHEGIVRGASRAERNLLGSLTGAFAVKDSEVLVSLGAVQN